jgi:hypothetical protein
MTKSPLEDIQAVLNELQAEHARWDKWQSDRQACRDAVQPLIDALFAAGRRPPGCPDLAAFIAERTRQLHSAGRLLKQHGLVGEIRGTLPAIGDARSSRAARAAEALLYAATELSEDELAAAVRDFYSEETNPERNVTDMQLRNLCEALARRVMEQNDPPTDSPWSDDPFASLRQSIQARRQAAQDAHAQQVRLDRLRQTLRQLTHPTSSERGESSDSALWTAKAWADRFMTAVTSLVTEGIRSVPDSVNRAEPAAKAHRVGIRLWALAFAGRRAELEDRLTALLADPESRALFQIALLDVNHWLIGTKEPGDCSYLSPPTPPLTAPEALLRQVEHARRYVHRVMRERPGATRWVRGVGGDIDFLRGEADALLPDLRPLWDAMHLMDRGEVPPFPTDTPDTSRDEPFRTLRLLDEVERWCRAGQPAAGPGTGTDSSECTEAGPLPRPAADGSTHLPEMLSTSDRARLVDQSSDPDEPVLIDCSTAERAPQPARPKRKRDRKLEARDRWLYGQCCKRIAYKVILTRLDDLCDQKGWPPITSIQGIRVAAQNYAERHGLPELPARQGF